MKKPAAVSRKNGSRKAASATRKKPTPKPAKKTSKARDPVIDLSNALADVSLALLQESFELRNGRVSNTKRAIQVAILTLQRLDENVL